MRYIPRYDVEFPALMIDAPALMINSPLSKLQAGFEHPFSVSQRD